VRTFSRKCSWLRLGLPRALLQRSIARSASEQRRTKQPSAPSRPFACFVAAELQPFSKVFPAPPLSLLSLPSLLSLCSLCSLSLSSLSLSSLSLSLLSLSLLSLLSSLSLSLLSLLSPLSLSPPSLRKSRTSGMGMGGPGRPGNLPKRWSFASHLFGRNPDRPGPPRHPKSAISGRSKNHVPSCPCEKNPGPFQKHPKDPWFF